MPSAIATAHEPIEGTRLIRRHDPRLGPQVGLNHSRARNQPHSGRGFGRRTKRPGLDPLEHGSLTGIEATCAVVIGSQDSHDGIPDGATPRIIERKSVQDAACALPSGFRAGPEREDGPGGAGQPPCSAEILPSCSTQLVRPAQQADHDGGTLRFRKRRSQAVPHLKVGFEGLATRFDQCASGGFRAGRTHVYDIQCAQHVSVLLRRPEQLARRHLFRIDQ